MARPADENSKRQRAFRLLNRLGVQRTTPAKRLAKIMNDLNVDKPYAQSIIATHKRQAKEEGTFVSTYRVRDKKDGKPCKPYMSRRGVYKVAVKKNDFLTPEDAKAAYITEQAEKINSAKVL